jgi:hypothetical protein
MIDRDAKSVYLEEIYASCLVDQFKFVFDCLLAASRASLSDEVPSRVANAMEKPQMAR